MVRDYMINSERIKWQNNKHSEEGYMIKRQHNKRTTWSRKYMIRGQYNKRTK